MIILDAQSSATIVGDIQSNAVSVNVNDIDFITTLLSTNLYSRPLESFLREIVSNAWDSHVEAGVKDPILLEIGTDTEGKDYCRIQDFGVGLSPERFNNIYKMMGSSTKRADNNQIGGFGIGRFSALAYSGTVHLTSNYEGIKYKYIMYKDGNKIKIDELFDTPTTDRNGFEVMVFFKRSGDIYSFQEAIKKQLIYFENLYLSADRYDGGSDMQHYVEKFNNLKIKKYKNFSVNTFDPRGGTTVCIGKIRYPLNAHAVYNTHFNFNANYPITVNFEIGDLLVTPNREEIQYDDDTVDKIQKKLNAVQDEIQDLINAAKVRDFSHLPDYIEAMRNGNISVDFYNDGIDKIYFIHSNADNKFTFNNQSFDRNIVRVYDYIVRDAFMVEHRDTDFIIDNGRLRKKDAGRNYNVKDIIDMIEDDECYVGSLSNFSAATKDYIRAEVKDDVRFFKEEISATIMLRRVLSSIKRRVTYEKKELKVVMSYVLQELGNMKHFTNDSVPQSFIDDREAEMKNRRQSGSTDSINWSEELNLFVLKESNRYNDETCTAVTSESTRVPLSLLKSNWNTFPVIYSHKNCPILRDLFWVFSKTPNNSYNKYVFVEIAPTKISNLKQFPNFINVLDYMDTKYKKIRALATAQLIKKTYPHLETLYNVNYQIEKVSKPLHDAIDKAHQYVLENSMRTYYHGAPEILKEISKMCEEHGYYDDEMMGFINENDVLLTNSKFLTLLTYSSRLDERLHNLAVDYALTKKLFKPNVDAVKKLREETIFNIKKEEK